MRARRAAAVAVAAALLGACTDREVTEPEPEPVTAANLAEALVPVTALDAVISSSDEPRPIATELIAEHACDDGILGLAPELEVARTYQVGTMALVNRVAWFPGGGATAEQVFRTAGSACGGMVTTGGSTVRTAALAFGPLSDDVFAVRYEVEQSPAVPITEIDVILVREGDLVSLVTAIGPRPSDKQVLDAVTRSAIGRLAGLRALTT